MSRFLVRILLAGALAGCVAGGDDGTDTDTDTVVHTDTDTVVDTETDTDTDTDPAVDTDLVTLPVTVQAGGAQVCADPTRWAEAPFDRVTFTVPAALAPYLDGSGAVVADLDGDDRLDLVAVTASAVVRYLQSPEGTFTASTLLTVAQPDAYSGLFGASAADYDGDGDLDLMVTGRGVRDALLANDGHGGFTDVTGSSGLIAIPDDHYTAGSAWHDMDGDGDLDLVLAGNGLIDETERELSDFAPADPTLLFDNQGDGTFRDASALLPEAVAGDYTLAVGWLDVDGDGIDELYLVNDFGGVLGPNRLLVRSGPLFALADDARGLDVGLEGMGLGLGDLDGDGDEDVVVPGWGEIAALRQRGGTWFDAAAALGLAGSGDQVVGWGTELVDIDNDGDLDVSQAYGLLATLDQDRQPVAQPDALFAQGSDGQFHDVAPALGIADTASHRAIVPADVNGDGLPDLLKVGFDGVVRLDLSRCNAAGWLTVRLQQPGPNRFAVGATVEARVGTRRVVRRLRAGGTGFASGGPMEVLLGLGDVDRVDAVWVTWPDGARSVVRDVDARQAIRIVRE
ncbi:MAG: CRTAC1 family protein [Alphaproteobacteria bacterium]|nr:CRTAC1 family protein [Alphaproteobacteria bacterium]